MRTLVVPLLVLALLSVPSALAAERVVDVTITESGCPGTHRFCLVPDRVSLNGEDDLVLRLHNEGTVRHNLTPAAGSPAILANATVDAIEPGGQATLHLAHDAMAEALEEAGGEIVFHCGFEGHRALGEALTVVQPDAGAEERPQPLGGLLAVLSLLMGAVWVRRARRDE
ncbi:MAG: hypothetical protein R3185_06605 [Candidatus Thermoplasmatota archaeon]|nr:hypothetical protein [Candidatus Thermoplasmatota archaeon]